MDPESIGSPTWAQIGQAVDLLWLFVAAMIVFLGALLLALGVMPSLAGTGHLSPRLLRVRPLLYAVSLLALAGAGYSLARAISVMAAALDFYPRFLI